MIDITSIIVSSMDRMHQNGKLEEIVIEKLQEAITSIVSSSLSWGSDARKMLEDEIKKEIGAAISQVNFTTYTNILREQVEEAIRSADPTEEQRNKIKDAVDDALRPAPKEIDFEELVNEIVLSENSHDESYHKDMDETPLEFFEHTLYVSRDDRGWKIGIDPENKINLHGERYPQFRCPIHFSIGENGCIYYLVIDGNGVKAGQPWHAHGDGKRKLIDMYYANTVIKGIEDFA